MSIKFSRVTLDREYGTAYVAYPLPRNYAPSQTIRVGGEESDVWADVTDFDDVLGIEIINVNVLEDVTRARVFAAERGLVFPDDLVTEAS